MPAQIPPPRIGTRFGQWRVVAVDHTGAIWCQCKCRLVKSVDARDLRAGKSKSCRACAATAARAERGGKS